ncbi:MAG: glycosyltransferase family 2 protein [Bacteriovoracaceae bacterium]|nr:glycosyltransferase family 2 protein [Bacteriovoracaceae bacterium]
MNGPLVTICIPSFNNATTIAQTLNSLVGQTYRPLRIKVFDNFSTDQTCNIVSEFQKQHHFIELNKNEKNIGAEANFEKCIQAGEGKYTAVFHADDIYLSDIIDMQVQVLENNSSVVSSCTHAHITDSSGKIKSKRFLPAEFLGHDHVVLDFTQLFKLTLKYGNIITCPSVMARTDIYKNNIKVWNGSKFKTSADLDVWLRLCKFGSMAFITKPLLIYRVATSSFSFNLFKVRIFRHHIFLVLDDYLKKEEVKKFINHVDNRNYNFLTYKDNALISYNIIKGRHHLEPYPANNFNTYTIITTGLQSLWHFKFLMYSLIINCLRLVIPRSFLKLLKGTNEAKN